MGQLEPVSFYEEIARNKTYFLNQLFLKFSGLRQDNPFSNTFGSTSLAVIEELEPETSRMRTGNKYLRYYLIQAAESIRKHDSEYKAFYTKKYQEVPKHKHKRALVLTARKLVRLVYSLLRTNQLYTPPERRD